MTCQGIILYTHKTCCPYPLTQGFQIFPSFLPIDSFHVSERTAQLDILGGAISEPLLMPIYLECSFISAFTILTIFKSQSTCPLVIFKNSISLLQLLFIITIYVFSSPGCLKDRICFWFMWVSEYSTYYLEWVSDWHFNYLNLMKSRGV